MKKHISILVLLLLLSLNSTAQTFSDDNFVYSAVPQRGVQAANYNTLTSSEVDQSVTYFDGLGRPIQTIGIGQGGDGSNIVTHMEYDAFGRQVKDYLPYASANAGNAFLKPGALTETNDFYNTIKYENTANPFSQKELEASPLNRVFQQAAPGNDWGMVNNQTIKLDYQANIANEVKHYTVTLAFANNTYTPTLSVSAVNSGFYAANVLYKSITKDENWIATAPDLNNRTTQEFKDKEGHVVLKRTFNNGVHDTYYVYDIYGNLTYVLPPKAEGLTDAGTIDNLCYQYKYDNRNRLVEKKLPGKEWEYIVYDKLDRPILTQDAILRQTNKWLFTKYDAFNRPVYTGDYVNATVGETTRAQIQGLVNASTIFSETKQGTNTINGTIIFYSNNAFPNINNININLLTINYYDDYAFDKDGLTITGTAGGQEIINYNDANKTLTRGLATGSKIRVLGTVSWITTLTGYDVKGRSIYTISKNNYLATINTITSQLDFTGKPVETTATHQKDNVTTTVVDAFSYDNSGRILTQKQILNNQAQEVIVANSYDNMGQLTNKGVGGKITQNRLQTVDYTYNIRGWLKNINDVNVIGGDLFAFQINYNDIADVSKKLYNGNISQTLWKTAYDVVGNSPRNYIYTYDALNRLTAAIDNYSPNLNRYNESASYDKNGNIINLTRTGNIVLNPTSGTPTDFGTMDNLVYTYDNSNMGNRLMRVVDSSLNAQGFKDGYTGGDDYKYDYNGNMTRDFNKGIGNATTDGITYNHLNLPTEIKFNNDINNKINYIYDATGTKQKKIVTQSGAVTETSYASGYIYEKLPNGTDIMKFFSQAEGYVEPNGSSFKYVYQYKDHLGNVRLSYKDVSSTNTPSLQIEEENNYYPFGLKQKGYNGATSSTNTALKYKYQGQERQDELGLNWDSFKWRNYDYTIGRFMSIDPLAEQYAYNSTYAFQENKMGLGRELEGLELHYSTASEIVNNTGFRPIVNAVKDLGNSFMSLFTPSKTEVQKVSTETTNVSLSTDNGGNENQKTTGPALDFMNVTSVIENMGSFAGLPGGKSKNGMTDAKTGNMVSNVKEKAELFKEGKDAAQSIGKAGDAVKTEVGNYSTKTTYTNGQVHTAGKKGNESQIKMDSLNLTETKAAGSAVKTVEIIRK